MKHIYSLLVLALTGFAVNAQTYLPLKDFQDQSLTSGGWQSFVVHSNPGSFDWTTSDQGSTGNFYGRATGYNSTTSSPDSTSLWLVSPAINLTSASSPELNFRNATNYSGPNLKLMISTDYLGMSDPTMQGTWTDLSSAVTWSSGTFTWTNGGPVDLSSYNGNNSVYIAFVYESGPTVSAATWEVDDIVVSEPVTPSTVTIFDIQNATGDSPYKDSTVITGGIVTAVNANGYSIQNNLGIFKGVWVKDATNAAIVQQGDSIIITAKVAEDFNFTVLQNISSFSVESSGNALPNPTTVTTFSANAEEYEGVLIEVLTATCNLDNDGFGQWVINDGSGNLLVDDEIYDYPSPTVNNIYNIRGIGWYAFSEFKIQPRDAGDINDITSVEDITVDVEIYPNPVVNVLNITNDEGIEIVIIYNELGEMVLNHSYTKESNIQVNTSDLSAGSYHVVITTPHGMVNKTIIK